MSMLDDLTANEKQVVIALPYRIGLWVSQSDASGGKDSRQEEIKTLCNIIHGFAQEVFGSELLQHIMMATLEAQDRWDRWGSNIDSVPDECRQALSILGKHVDAKDLNAYVVRLMEIAEAVALAFREDPVRLNPLSQLGLRLKYLRSITKGIIYRQPVKNFEQFLRISPEERKALIELARALGTKAAV